MKSCKKLGGVSKDIAVELRNSNVTINCISCKLDLPIRKFSFAINKKNGKYYLRYECYNCAYKRKLEKHGYKSSSYNATQIYKQDYTIGGRASLLYNRCKQRAKKYGY